MGTSSADPFKLSTYATDGVGLVATLRADATALTTALDSLRASGSPHLPAVGDPDVDLADLVGDWQHLDEFAGDVANGFFQANQHLLDGPRAPGLAETWVATLSDDALLRNGQLGYADRDVAVAEAERLAADLARAMEGRPPSAEDMIRLSDRAARGQHDPAFAVTLLEALGVDGMVRVPALIEAAWPGAQYGRNPGWGQEVLAPFPLLLRTAMDTRATTPRNDRHDVANHDLADEDRLDDAWIDEFTAFWQPVDHDAPSNLHHSLLVRDADLPTDVLVAVTDRQLDYVLARDITPQLHLNGVPWGWEDSTPELNVLDALGSNRDASLEWLDQTSPGDGTVTYPGRTVSNIEMLLRYDPGTDDPILGERLATVLDNGLQHLDDRSGDLFETAIATVADQDEVHLQPLLPVLGEGARTHIDLLAARTNEVPTATVGHSDEGALQPLYDAHDFLKVVMADDTAANAVYQGGFEYVQDRVSSDSGDGFGGESRAIGALVGLITEADENAAVEVTEARIASRESLVKGSNLIKDVVGLTPAGTVARATAVGFYHLNNFGVPGADGLDVNADYAHIENVRAGIRSELTAATAAYSYGIEGTWTTDEVIRTTEQALGDRAAGADTDFFVEGTTGDQRPIKPYGDMSEQERQAYVAWLNSDQVGDVIAGDRTAAGQRMDEVIDSLDHR